MQSLHPLPQKFYIRDTHTVAKNILGKLLVRKKDTILLIGRINEVECYGGLDDAASHASKGRTKRTEVMFGPAGRAYVYLIYGMYYCFNVVTEVENFPAAILIRGCIPEKNVTSATDGPGKLCRAFSIDTSLNTHDLTRKSELFIADDGTTISPKEIKTSPRIGVDYAGEHALLPWRYYYSK